MTHLDKVILELPLVCKAWIEEKAIRLLPLPHLLPLCDGRIFLDECGYLRRGGNGERFTHETEKGTEKGLYWVCVAYA